MDSYTASTMEWLNRRYRKTTADGIYLAHQPIYGIYDPNSEPNVMERYLRSYHIVKSLSHLKGDSVLDVGASEGFQASLIQNLLGLKVTCCDLSEEACKRAQEIFGLEAYQADARALQFQDGQFDIVTCSETLEHVKDYQAAVEELLRVAKTAVVITVPHEPHEQVEQNQAAGELHAHINAFELNSFDYLNSQGITVLATKHQSRYWHRPSEWVERLRLSGSAARLLVMPLSLSIIHSDSLFAKNQSVYYGTLFVLLKDKSAYSEQSRRVIKASDILNYRVPHYYLGAK